ncbi:MAG TPA: succinyldiaminopimelate transaminase, partial [Gammaproteobacteria bacterium]|nr:succinyldiaminopimelate transaminase [Gammaproteobacteria bacterium]
KFDAVIPVLAGHLGVQSPPGGFYLWAETPVSDTDFALRLYSGQNIRVLPGSFLSRETNGINPGDHRLRIALVAPLEECVEAAERISQCLSTQ